MHLTIEPPRLDPASRSFLRRLSELTPEERRCAYAHGRFSHRQCVLWASTYPQEPPLINGELPWIALALADLD